MNLHDDWLEADYAYYEHKNLLEMKHDLNIFSAAQKAMKEGSDKMYNYDINYISALPDIHKLREMIQVLEEVRDITL